MNVISKKADATLLARLKTAAKSPLTQSDIEQQRISFVYSIVGGRKDMTREKVEDLLKLHAAA